MPWSTRCASSSAVAATPEAGVLGPRRPDRCAPIRSHPFLVPRHIVRPTPRTDPLDITPGFSPRYGPSGDTTPRAATTVAMAVSTLPAALLQKSG